MITFFNSFFNYVVLLIVFAAVGGLGAFLGILARKKKDAADALKQNDVE